jgi:putative tryptophan/tyrosine transport system substrate-binding protein
MSATRKRRPSSSGSRLMSLSRWLPRQPSRQSKRQRVIPIVFGAASDPVGTGLVESLARPGGNVTGLSNQISDTGGKKLEFLREVVPSLRRLAILANVGNPAVVLDMGEAQAAARKLGLEVTTSEIRRAEDIAPAFDAIKGRADALYVCTDPLVNTHRIRVNTLALAARLPTIHGLREYVEAGGLMSYGPNLPDLMRRAADYVDKILHGAKPGDIPVEQPTRFDLIINLTTAKALGLEIPPTLLVRADEVIE